MKTKTALTLALLVVALGAALGLGLGISRLLGGLRPFEKNVSEGFIVYIEGMSPTGKLVLVESVERLKASKEFTMKVLSVVALQASIKVTALADVAYYVDLTDSSRWKASWSPALGRLEILVPRPECLPPAIRTDTIEVSTEGANLLSSAIFRIRREVEVMRSELSADFLVQSRAVLATPELRDKMAASLETTARAFCQNVLGVSPKKIVVTFSKAGEALSR